MRRFWLGGLLTILPLLGCKSSAGKDGEAQGDSLDAGSTDLASADQASDAAPADQGSDAGDDDEPFGARRLACAYSAGAKPATTFGPSVVATRIPIDTFVIIAQENRSFDHYFSQLPAYGQPDVDVASSTASNLDVNGQPVVRFRQTNYCFADTPHSWNAMHAAWDNGKNDGFVLASEPGGARALGYFDSRDLPFYYGFASTFGTSDRYFSPTLSNTYANRFYLYAATSSGAVWPESPGPSYDGTIFAALTAAGIPFAVYTNTSSSIAFSYETALFAQLGTPGPWAEFVNLAAAGTLPNVVFLYPDALNCDEHPPCNMQLGQIEVASVYAVLAQSPQWIRSALIVTYDEAGGLYDHAPPPVACKPDEVAPQLRPGDVAADFGRYGFRVPILVASAWSKPHYVSHTVNDHTSVLRLIELRFGLPALTARDANANALLDLFDFSHPSFPVAPRLPQATVDPGTCP
jgi:phospholipase C